jgi:CDP-diacylglycerol--glycerol-3-phosphate 3-phosphatidyltransferase
MNIPNSLTLFRILLIPVFVVVFYLQVSWNYVLATAIFGLAAITDILDGYLARKLGQISRLGEFLDPVADKLMIAVVLVLLVQENPTIWLALPAAVIIGREITVSALREWMAELGARRKVAVSYIGKVKTVAQMAALLLLIYHAPIVGLPIYKIGMISLYVAAILTLLSMFHYIYLAWPELTDNKNTNP